jgi:hypothetical protein
MSPNRCQRDEGALEHLNTYISSPLFLFICVNLVNLWIPPHFFRLSGKHPHTIFPVR